MRVSLRLHLPLAAVLAVVLLLSLLTACASEEGTSRDNSESGASRETPGSLQAGAAPDSKGFAAVSAGGSHTCGVKTNGSVACWGADDYGQATPPPREVLLGQRWGEAHLRGGDQWLRRLLGLGRIRAGHPTRRAVHRAQRRCNLHLWN